MKDKRLLEYLGDFAATDAVTIDGMDSAIIGTTYDGRVAYDQEKVVEILLNEQGVALDDIDEWLDETTIWSERAGLAPVVVNFYEEEADEEKDTSNREASV